MTDEAAVEFSTAPALGTISQRRERGAFFTPSEIASYLAGWAVGSDPEAVILDPTVGGGVFLQAAGERLRNLGTDSDSLRRQLYGIDVHEATIAETARHLSEMGTPASLSVGDFFATPPPGAVGSPVPFVDAVLGNPPFVRFQQHSGESRRLSVEAALRQGVSLPGTASSWAASLVHASAFLKPDGRIALVVPAELLTVSYAEPVRQWLRRRFSFVRLVFFEKLQFPDAQERVVLLIASGSGGCDSFSLVHVEDGRGLETIHPFDVASGLPSAEGKWTELMLTLEQRSLLKSLVADKFSPLSDYGKLELGTVTGANSFFCLTEEQRVFWGLDERTDVLKTIPPGGQGLSSSVSFTTRSWRHRRDAGERVWMLSPKADPTKTSVRTFLASGQAAQVHTGYKCRTRTPWWGVRAVPPTELVLNYMSHWGPRLTANEMGAVFTNSLLGLRLAQPLSKAATRALAFSTFNSLTCLAAEVSGRAYGGGVLKLEPSEASRLPVVRPESLVDFAERVAKHERKLRTLLAQGDFDGVNVLVDSLLLHETLGLSDREISTVRGAAKGLRDRRRAT